MALASPGDAVIVPTLAAKRVLDRQWKNLQALVPDALNCEFPELLVEQYDLREQNSTGGERRAAVGAGSLAEGDVVRIAVVGRLEAGDKMDWASLIEMLGRVARRGLQFECTVMGYASSLALPRLLEAALARYGLTDRVNVVSNATDLERDDLLKSADIYVNLSVTQSESFGLGLLEAMRNGCAVVASDWGPYRNVIRNGIDGDLVPVYTAPERSADIAVCALSGIGRDFPSTTVDSTVDTVMLTGHISDLILDRPLRLRRQVAARARAAALDSARPFAQRLEDLLVSKASPFSMDVTDVQDPFESYPSHAFTASQAAASDGESLLRAVAPLWYSPGSEHHEGLSAWERVKLSLDKLVPDSISGDRLG
ncbi:glycosyltransferase [Kribbella sp. ALI-6-A]|uniref:glycosyltransferase n=1 Tax=Kribbella sp. ALI-6-A TaxID=1933817 RepID=UPI00143D279F|nr:glycosyltransferase [Kribbella sp. ALI-6-A]